MIYSFSTQANCLIEQLSFISQIFHMILLVLLDFLSSNFYKVYRSIGFLSTRLFYKSNSLESFALVLQHYKLFSEVQPQQNLVDPKLILQALFLCRNLFSILIYQNFKLVLSSSFLMIMSVVIAPHFISLICQLFTCLKQWSRYVEFL